MKSSFFLKEYIQELNNVIDEINTEEFNDFIEELLKAHENDFNIFVFGNGGSASTASHFACDINKGTRINGNRRFKVVCLNDNIPTTLAYANDLCYEDIFIEQLKNFFNAGDLVVGISGSGNSKNVLKAVEYANKNRGRTFGLCGFSGGKLKKISQKSFCAKINDMQKVEDLHLVFMHCVMQYINNLKQLR